MNKQKDKERIPVDTLKQIKPKVHEESSNRTPEARYNRDVQGKAQVLP
jgi:hypothetical protein